MSVIFEAYETEPEEKEEGLEEDNGEVKFQLQKGEIKNTHKHQHIINTDFNSDYTDISASGSITLPYNREDLQHLYMGVRCRLTGDDEEYLLGFITDSSISSEQLKLSLSGMSKCLDEKQEFQFTQTPISKIMEEVIQAAGLTPVIDFTGLEDQVIDFSTNNSNETEDTGDVEVSTNIKTLAKNITKGQKTPLDKAKSIFNWLHDNITYDYYYNHRYSPEEVLSKKRANCVDHAILYWKLGSAVGLKVGYVNVSCLKGHVYNGIDINGKIYTADASVKSIGEFNKTKGSCPMVTSSNIQYNWSMWGV